ncbi:hypothetical protein ABK040_013620 [Willaertia magna]
MKFQINQTEIEMILLTNCSFIPELIEAQKTTCFMACINPKMIPSLFVIQTLLHNILLRNNNLQSNLQSNRMVDNNTTIINNNKEETILNWKTENIHTELIYCLHPKRNIGQAFKDFSAKENQVLCISCSNINVNNNNLNNINLNNNNSGTNLREYLNKFNSDNDSVKMMEEKEEIERYLKENVDVELLCKLFKFSTFEKNTFNLEDNMLTYLTVRDY